MPARDDADIAELRTALEECCAELAQLLDAVDGGSDVAGALVDPGALDAAGLQWRSLVLGDIPGIQELAEVIQPPIEVVVALLEVIAAILEQLANIVAGLTDPYRALIMAAYEAINALIQDILNAGVYLFFDAPGITSPMTDGFAVDPVAEFTAGQAGGPAPEPPPSGFRTWAKHFLESFDDPGDDQRPILSDGSSVNGVFILASAPTLAALRPPLFMAGQLLQVDAFVESVERFSEGSPDPRRSRARTESVAPDWYARRMRDLFPPLRELERIPEALEGLLLLGEGLAQLLDDLVDAMKDKVAVLEELAKAIDGVIELLDALQSAGLYSLAVSSSEGPRGMHRAFLSATNRPPGEYVGGVCMLAGLPGFADPAPLWELLGVGGFSEAPAERSPGMAGYPHAEGPASGDERSDGGDTPDVLAARFADALASAPETLVQAIGRPREELISLARTDRNRLVRWIERALEELEGRSERVDVDPDLVSGLGRTRDARGRAPRSLALGHGLSAGQDPKTGGRR